MEAIEKRKPGRHFKECKCKWCVATRARLTEKPGTQTSKEPVVVGGRDELEVKLDHFQYSMDPREVAVWEQDETISPLSVPSDIQKKYPQFAWRYVSQLKLNTRGRGYHGWELFSDSKLGYPDGVKRGNDLFLAAMPKELAESYRRTVSERSTEAVKDIQLRGMARMESALAGMPGEYQAEIIAEGGKVGGRTTLGITVGRNEARGFQRGLSREEVHNQIAKSIAERKKNKVYMDMGNR